MSSLVLRTARFGLAAALPLAVMAPVGAEPLSILRPPVSALTGTGHGSVQSSNWSGYAVAAGSEFTDAQGTWVQPAVKCSSGSQYSSFWVGIDGYTSTSVEQLGTDSDCSSGRPNYYGWYEMYPAGSVNLGSKYPVKPGDTLTASVSRSGTSYTLSLASSEGWNFSIVKSGSHANSSAEWIIESPEICSITCSLAKLADFGSVHFSASEASAGSGLSPISSFTSSGSPYRITMATKKTVRSSPSALGSGGASFTATWVHS